MMNHFITPSVIAQRLQLDAVSEIDTVSLFLLRSNKQVAKHIQRKLPNSILDLEDFIQNIKQSESEGQTFFWAIKLRDYSTFIGTICLWNFSQDKKSAEVGYELLPTFAGLGYMDEALKAVISFAKGRKFTTLEAYTNEENLSSIKLLRRNGFQQLPTKNKIESPNNIVFQLVC